MNQTAKIINQAKKAGRSALLETEAKSVCIEYGIPVVESELAGTAEEAVAAAGRIGFPVVLKVVSPGIVHKTEAGGVLVNLKSEAEVAAGYAENSGERR